MSDDDRSETPAPQSRLLGVIFIAVFAFVLYQGYRSFFVYTGDHLTRHDEGILERAEGGEAHAQYLMGTFRLSGRQALARDPVIARRWLEKAAAQDYPPAWYRLGQLYHHGEGVAADPSEAARLFALAAQTGDLPARTALGDLYLEGEGVEADPARALALFRAAAEEGHPPAQRKLGYLAAEGRGMPRDYALAREWYLKAAEQADSIAMSNLGLIYEHGQGVEADPLRAWDCYYRASLLGRGGSQRHFDRVEKRLPPEWHAQGLYERDGRDCLTGGYKKITKPVSRVRK